MIKPINKNEILAHIKTIGHKTKKAILVSGSWDDSYAIATIVFDNIKPQPEIHKKAADVWHILKGEGKFILGGHLINQEKISQNELTGDSIKGGKIFKVKTGDWIDIPAGMSHQIDARGERLETMIIKIKSCG